MILQRLDLQARSQTPRCYAAARVERLSRARPAKQRGVPFTARRPEVKNWNVLHQDNHTTVVCLCAPTEQVQEEEVPPEEQDFDILSNKVAELQGPLIKDLRGCSIYLIGMMGTGKSTLGKMLANTFKYAFFDTDALIEATHEKKPVSEIFKEYGEPYFRQCETQVLQQLSSYKDLVVATGGGAVKDPYNWSFMRNGIVVWLQGDVDLLTRRVLKDGPSKRPLLYSPDTPEDKAYEVTYNKVNNLLQERLKFYENADVIVDIKGFGQDKATGAPTAVVMYRVLQAVDKKLKDTIKEKEEHARAAQARFNTQIGNEE